MFRCYGDHSLDKDNICFQRVTLCVFEAVADYLHVEGRLPWLACSESVYRPGRASRVRAKKVMSP